MNYEVVNLEEKTIVGVSAVTGNSDPEMGRIIGGLWEKLYQRGAIASIKNRASAYAIGLYSDYTDSEYCVTTGIEVSKAENPELTVKTIPAGKYAKFLVHGDMVQAVANAWGQIWQMNLDRSFTGDFEEYMSSDPENCEIALYIALK